jgi:hypothetical protein
LTDVVVPIPLPLSAILILVIGTYPSSNSFALLTSLLDLGFELFVAVGFHFLQTFRNLTIGRSPSFLLPGINQKLPMD